MSELPAHPSDLRLLDPTKTTLVLDDSRRLQVQIGIEERIGPVRAIRSLPLTQPERYISIQDDEGVEIGVIKDMRELDSQSRAALQEELDYYYLKAKVTRILRVEARHGLITWQLETHLGPRTVHVRDRQHIRSLADGRTILTDIHEGKYEIPPMAQLDEKSVHWLSVEV